jgi:hypothetical protein
MSAAPRASDVELFEQFLAEEPGPWAAAKRDAFWRLCEAFPGPDGPPPEGLRQLERGGYDVRVPREWRAVFAEVYIQWLGFRAERQALAPAPPLSPRWWCEPVGALRATPRPLWALLSPGAALVLALGLATFLVLRGVSARHEAEDALRGLAAAAENAQADLATAERLALASLTGGSDASVESYLATEPSLRSRLDFARERARELRAACSDSSQTPPNRRSRAW